MRKMVVEVIIICIFAASTILAAVLAIHNIAELTDTSVKYNKAVGVQQLLKAEIDTLRDENFTLEQELETERNNSMALKRMIIDYETAAKTGQEDPLNELDVNANQNDNVLQANAESSKERLPEGRTNVISGMPYTTITNKRSEQWALQLQAYTGKYGIRCYFDGDHIYFLAAMGSAYGRTIGDAFRVTLRCGTEFYVMLAEYKDDGSDPNFFGHPTKHIDGYDVTCVLEFIYDKASINSKALQAGNFCVLECFGGLHGDGGDIVRIEYLGRKWEP